jgi:hypothetical protein
MTDQPIEKTGNGGQIAAISAGALLVAAHAALWFYFRARQPAADEQTRDRLRPGKRP